MVWSGCGGPGGDPPKAFTTGPAIASITPNSGASTGGTNITITGTGFSSGARVFLGAMEATGVTVLSGGQITAVTPAQASGSVTVEVRNRGTGGSAFLSNGFTYTAGIAISSISPNSGSINGGASVTITGAGFLSGATVSFGGTPAPSVTFVGSTQLTATTPAHAAGPVTVLVTNPTSQSTQMVNGFTFTGPPVISSVSPNTGPSGGGTTVTIAGSNFASGSTVSFGGTAATSVIFNSSTQLTAVTPAHVAGAVNVVVAVPGQPNATLTNGFTYLATPTITSISPNSGTAAGGTSTTITGTNFQSGATVSFGGTAAASVTFNSSTQLTAVTPARAAGAVNVVVTNPGGQSATLTNGFTFLTALTITSISPAAGPPSGGTTTTISGAGFLSGATVSFGGTAATSVTFNSSAQLTAVAPAHIAGTVNVVVTNSGGQSTTLSGGFSYTVNLSISTISPSSGPSAGGTAVTITGTGFKAGAAVQFGTVQAPSVTVVNSTQITTTTPAQAPATVDVTVFNEFDEFEATVTNGFTYVGSPTVTSVTPTSGPTSGGTTVSIAGTNFQAGATVSFGGTAAPSVTFISATLLSAITPARPAGTVTVQVTNPGGFSGSKANAYTFVAAPAVSSVSPNLGGSAGGTPVTVTGTGLTPSTAVLFGGVDSGAPTFVSSTQLSVVTPAHNVGLVDVTIVNPDNQSGTLSGAFTYQLSKTIATEPFISGVSPASGPPGGGTQVSITGNDFQTGASVTFGSLPAFSVSVISGGQISAFTPAQSAGMVDVNVTNTDANSALLTNGYFYEGVSITTAVPGV
ncbi:MAG: beta strand repeat-containing protein, partial [Terriglobales bacterium]